MDDNGFLIRIEDIAEVERTAASPPSEIGVVNGKPAIIVAARMQPTLRVDQWTDRMNRLLDQYRQQLPSNVSVDVIFEQQSYTETRLSDLNQSLLLGFSIILVVLLLTLGIRSAIIVAISLHLLA